MLDVNQTSDEAIDHAPVQEACLRLPWSDSFPPVYVHSPYGFPNHNGCIYHKDYNVGVAKNGGISGGNLEEALDAAEYAIDSYLREDSVESLRSHLRGNSTFVVSPVKPSYPCGNVLARAFAAAIANELGVELCSGVYQYPRMKRDKKTDFFVRLSHPVDFFSDPNKDVSDIIEIGADYIIADDVFTFGGTLAALRGFIECHGGNVICMTTLAGMPQPWNRNCLKSLPIREIKNYGRGIFGIPPGEFPIAIKAQALSKLENYNGGVFRGFFEEELGYGLSCLTQREANGILCRLPQSRTRFSLDFWRKKIVSARCESNGNRS